MVLSRFLKYGNPVVFFLSFYMYLIPGGILLRFPGKALNKTYFPAGRFNLIGSFPFLGRNRLGEEGQECGKEKRKGFESPSCHGSIP
jgi:hypothetical protein